MHFTAEIDIPKPLIEASWNDKLVVFVGAGVSCQAYPRQNPKTYYPGFSGLVKRIARRLGKSLTEEQNKSLKQGFADRVLGELEHQGYDVQMIASKILQENEVKQRIELHKAIIQLFPKSGTPRIVTTNFDSHLIRAHREFGLEGEESWKTHEAPSLPPARRFSGICFLHGRATKPREMILTDRDIGRAYMDEGWALKFAHGLFSEFHVLFIGYSLQDPPLRYLSLALSGIKNREHWSFVSEPKKAEHRDKVQRDWIRRGVKPIWFPVRRGDYRALENCIKAWAADNSRGYVDRRNLLNQWALTNPLRLRPHDLARAEFFLSRTPELLRDFASTQVEETWFDYLIDWGYFDFLLKGIEEYKEADYHLAQILTHWLMDEPIKWLLKLIPYRESINPFFLEVLFRGLEDNDSITIEDLLKSLEFFIIAIERDKRKTWSHHIKKVLIKLVDAGCIGDAIWVFTRNTQISSRSQMRPNLEYHYSKSAGEDLKSLSPDTIEFEMDFANQFQGDFGLERIRDVFLPNVKLVGYPLIIALTSQFHDMRIALRRGGRGSYTYYHRRAIEPHSQDKHTEGPEHFFIDALRDLWEALLKVEPQKAFKILEHWREIDDVMFRRLSIHATRIILES